MGISKAFIDRLRERITLSEFIGKRVKVQRAGREFKACCPFHNEKTPSFTINDQKGFYHCFGCGAHGDVLGFTMQYDNLDFIDAVEKLAAEAGLEVPKSSPQEVKRHREEKDHYAYLETACKWFEEALFKPEFHYALSYLKERGLSEEQIRAFRIGFAPQDRDLFVQAMGKESLAMPDLEKLGLVRKHKNKDGYYAFFRGRIMFPVMNKRGRVVAFGGRILPQYDVQEGDYKPAKYMNSPDHMLFHKGELLYNFTKARQAANQGQPVIVTEGYMDVIALSKAGFTGAVAPLGTALTENQIVLGWSITMPDDQNLYLCFDGDEAGKRAAYRALERILPLLAPGKSAKFIFMPEGQDPDSLIREKGRQALQNLLEHAEPMHDVLWRMETEGRLINTPEAKAGLKARLEKHAEVIADKTVQSYYFRDINDKMFKAFSNFKKGFKGRGANNNQPMTSKVEKPLSKKDRLRGEILMACMINHPIYLSGKEEVLAELLIDNDGLYALRNELVDILAEDEGLERDGLITVLKERGHTQTLEKLLNQNTYLHGPFAAPDTEQPELIEGWDDIVNIMRKEGMIVDLRGTANVDLNDKQSGKVINRMRNLGQMVLKENWQED